MKTRSWTRAAATLGVIAASTLTMGASASAQTAEKPVRGGTIVVANHYPEPNTFDCHAATSPSVMTRVAPHYSSLLQIDADNYPQIKGDLAQSWKISPDGKTYEFKLHRNVKFHDGSTLSSTDVKVSYDRIRNPPTGVVSPRSAMYEDIKSIEAPDALTVMIHMHRPNAAMLQLLAVPYSCVYSAKLLAQDPTYPAKKIMGTGPFRFTRYLTGQEWAGERFDEYFKAPLPYADGFRSLSISRAADMTALASGQVMFGMRGLTKDEVARVLSVRGDTVRVVGQDKTNAVGFLLAVNTTRPPFNDVRVRRALLLATDRWGTGAALERQYTLAKVGAFQRPNSTFARSNKELEQLPGFGRDVEAARREARRLLTEAGHSDLKLTLLNFRAYPWVGVLLSDQLRQIGVSVNHVSLDGPQLAARRAAGDYDLVVDLPPEYLDDPTLQMSIFLPHKFNPTNNSRSNDEKVSQMYEAQKIELDPAKRKEKVQALEEYLLQQAYYLPVFWNSDFTRVLSSDLGGLDGISSNFSKLDLADIWLRSGGK